MGAFVLDLLNVHPSGEINEDAQFENLWKASVISTTLPLATLWLLPILIPDAKQTDALLPPGERSATRGSLWHRLMGVVEEPLEDAAEEQAGSPATGPIGGPLAPLTHPQPV